MNILYFCIGVVVGGVVITFIIAALIISGTISREEEKGEK